MKMRSYTVKFKVTILASILSLILNIKVDIIYNLLHDFTLLIYSADMTTFESAFN
jgi:hypothetical protein